ncbi:MAG: acetate--CoA ligase family protein [Candidatus Caldarchaeum sp.]
MGFIRPYISLNASFFNKTPEPGQIAFISQSGALGSSILDWAVTRHIGFSMFASLGSMLDIDFGDLIDFLGQDPYTKSILLYMESVGNARKFMSAARGFARNKPIIIIKPGKFETAAKAAKSHTGALVGSFEVYRAAFRRAGAVRVDEIQELFNCASVLDSRRLPVGLNLAVITNAGGLGVITADAIEEYGAKLATLSDKTIDELDGVLPSYWSRGNPIDILGDADVRRYTTALRLCLKDRNIDGVIIIYTPQGAAEPNELAESVVSVVREYEWVKPVLTVWVGGDSLNEARNIFHRNDIPTYDTPEQAVKTYIYMYKYKRNLELLYETPEDLPIDPSPPKNFLKILVRKALNEGRYVLTPDEANKFLDVYGIPRPDGVLISNIQEALSAAHHMGFPIALKIVSPKIVHKTDVGGVVLNISSDEELRKVYSNMTEALKTVVQQPVDNAVFVQKMVEPVHYELIVGSKKDPDFGSVIMFGAGGVATEFLRDTSVGLPQLNQVVARRLMEETRIYSVLQKGLRNKPPADLRKLEEIIVRFSNIIVDLPEIKEAEINPLIV